MRVIDLMVGSKHARFKKIEHLGLKILSRVLLRHKESKYQPSIFNNSMENPIGMLLPTADVATIQVRTIILKLTMTQ